MEIISQKNLDTLLEMGFQITYQEDTCIRLYNGKYDLGIDLYHSDPRDDFQGVYMDITRDKISLKQGKGRNVISNITRYLEKYPPKRIFE